MTSLDDGRKAPFTESTCEEVLETGGDTRSVGLSSELHRAPLEVSFGWFKYQNCAIGGLSINYSLP